MTACEELLEDIERRFGYLAPEYDRSVALAAVERHVASSGIERCQDYPLTPEATRTLFLVLVVEFTPLFRDLLSLPPGASASEIFRRIELAARALVDATRGYPNPEQIYQLLRVNIGGANPSSGPLTDEYDPFARESETNGVIIENTFIEAISHELAAAARRVAFARRWPAGEGGVWTVGTQEQAQELFFDRSHTKISPSAKGTGLSVLVRLGEESSPGLRNLEGVLRRYVSGRNTPNRLFDGFCLSSVSPRTSKPVERAEDLVRAAVEEIGARPSPLLDAAIRWTARAMAGGEGWRAFRGYCLLGHIPEIRETEAAFEERDRRPNGSPAFVEETRVDVDAIRTPMSHPPAPRLSLRRVSGLDPRAPGKLPLADLRMRGGETLQRIVSVRPDDLLRELAGAPIVYKGVAGRMGEPGVAGEVARDITRMARLVMTPQQLRDAIAARDTDTPVDLDRLIRDHSALIRRLDDPALSSLINAEERSPVAQGYLPLKALAPVEAPPLPDLQRRIGEGMHPYQALALDLPPPEEGMERHYLGVDASDAMVVTSYDQLPSLQVADAQGTLYARTFDLPVGQAPPTDPEVLEDMYGDEGPGSPVRDLVDRRRFHQRSQVSVRSTEDLVEQLGPLKNAPPPAPPKTSAVFEPLGDEYRAGFEEGYRSQSAGLGLLRTKEGERVVVAGSSLGVPLEEQQRRALGFLDGQGGLLDIETPADGSKRIKDIYLGVMRDGELVDAYDWDKGISEGENISALVEALRGTDAPVGTMTPYDWAALAERARHHGLEGDATFLRETAVRQGFDARTFFQLAGVDAGDASQQAIMARAHQDGVRFEDPLTGLDREGAEELHVAKPDTRDLYRAMRHHEEDARANRLTLLSAQEVRDRNLVLYGEDTRGPLRKGSMYRLLDAQVEPTGQVTAVYQGLTPIEGGGYEPGALFAQSFGGPESDGLDLLGKQVLHDSIVVTPENHARLTEGYYRELDDLASRTARSLSPFERTIADPWRDPNDYDPWRDPNVYWDSGRGPYAMTALRMEREAGRVLRALALSGEVARVRAVPPEDRLAAAMVVMSSRSTYGDYGDGERIRRRVTQALLDPGEEYLLLGSRLAQRLAGDVGQLLDAAAEHNQYGAGIVYVIVYERLLRKAALDRRDGRGSDSATEMPLETYVATLSPEIELGYAARLLHESLDFAEAYSIQNGPRSLQLLCERAMETVERHLATADAEHRSLTDEERTSSGKLIEEAQTNPNRYRRLRASRGVVSDLRRDFSSAEDFYWVDEPYRFQRFPLLSAWDDGIVDPDDLDDDEEFWVGYARVDSRDSYEHGYDEWGDLSHGYYRW